MNQLELVHKAIDAMSAAALAGDVQAGRIAQRMVKQSVSLARQLTGNYTTAGGQAALEALRKEVLSADEWRRSSLTEGSPQGTPFVDALTAKQRALLIEICLRILDSDRREVLGEPSADHVDEEVDRICALGAESIDYSPVISTVQDAFSKVARATSADAK